MDFFTFDDEYVRRLREGDPCTEEHYEHYFGLLLIAYCNLPTGFSVAFSHTHS